MPAKSVFISHASKDDAQVRELRHALELLEISAWTDSESLTPGAPLTKEIERNIESADAFVVLLTLDGFQSPWVRNEIKHAQKSGKEVIPLLGTGVVPVMLEGLFLEERVAITLTEGPAAMENAVRSILTALWFEEEDARGLERLALSGEFQIVFEPGMTASQITGTLTALANYFRACGGVGIPADLEMERADVLEGIYA